jgi:hypothetical protein
MLGAGFGVEGRASRPVRDQDGQALAEQRRDAGKTPPALRIEKRFAVLSALADKFRTPRSSSTYTIFPVPIYTRVDIRNADKRGGTSNQRRGGALVRAKFVMFHAKTP